MASQKKLDQVTDLQKKLDQTPNFALVKFDKTTHQSLEELRRELKKSNAAFKVIKNALFQKAVEQLADKNKKLEDLNKELRALTENTALLTLDEDYISGLSSFHKFAKKDETLTFKFGQIDGGFMSQDKLSALAQLPPKEELIAKIIGSLKSGPSHLVHAMKYNVTKLAYVLSERGKQAS